MNREHLVNGNLITRRKRRRKEVEEMGEGNGEEACFVLREPV